MRSDLTKIFDYTLRESMLFLASKIWYSIFKDKNDPSILKLHDAFSVFVTEHLKNIKPEKFENSIKSRIGSADFNIEGYREDEILQQRDLSIKFHWGHNHDFGTFAINGLMGDRHIYLMSKFLKYFPITLKDFKERNVFDIGCWTGGTTLLLQALGSKVTAIEEVKKYAEVVEFLCNAFGIEDKVEIKPISLYECDGDSFFNNFDIAYFPGVIYHLSDPVLSLRIIYNSLKLGGVVLIETAGINTNKPFCRFDGNYIYRTGRKERKNRTGWNWFIPSPLALKRMMSEAGFETIQTKWDYKTNRLYAYGKKDKHLGICKAGLSSPNIK
jgi:SAM-dependent methyltransferase